MNVFLGVYRKENKKSYCVILSSNIFFSLATMLFTKNTLTKERNDEISELTTG